MNIAYQAASDISSQSPGFIGLFEPASNTQGMRWPMSQRIAQFRLPDLEGPGNADALLAGEPDVLRLQLIYEIITKPEDQAPFRYLLGCSVDPAAEPEFHQWYDEEHLPGLAAVSGTIRAARYRSVDRVSGQARWFAEYHVTDPTVVGSPDWLKVRHTPWSDRIIPHMQRVERTMLRRVSV